MTIGTLRMIRVILICSVDPERTFQIASPAYLVGRMAANITPPSYIESR